MGGSGPEGHGLARFNHDLTVDWLYPQGTGLPYISDCYTLNLDGETAHFCPYTDFRIQSASGDKVTDWGASPYRSAHDMLVRGADRALLSGWGSEYDVVTLVRIGQDGVRRFGAQCRIVLPMAWRHNACVTPAAAATYTPSPNGEGGTAPAWRR